MAQHVLLKRAYEKPAKSDGFRVLVDRLWPRGVSKDELQVRMWAKEIAPSTKFRHLLDRYLQAYINLLGQLAACNRLHSVYERCARWLLMTHDRVRADVLPLTHEYLGMMLGTRRSGVTIAAATLKAAGFIEYTQGRITILDRPGLEAASCECYAVARSQFGELL